MAVLSDERHVGALLTTVPTLALETGPLADDGRKDHLEALAGQRPAPASAPLARRPPLGPAARAQQQRQQQRQQPRRPRPRPRPAGQDAGVGGGASAGDSDLARFIYSIALGLKNTGEIASHFPQAH